MVPLEVRAWDADIDWSVPDAREAWDEWRDLDEKLQRSVDDEVCVFVGMYGCMCACV